MKHADAAFWQKRSGFPAQCWCRLISRRFDHGAEPARSAATVSCGALFPSIMNRGKVPRYRTAKPSSRLISEFSESIFLDAADYGNRASGIRNFPSADRSREPASIRVGFTTWVSEKPKSLLRKGWAERLLGYSLIHQSCACRHARVHRRPELLSHRCQRASRMGEVLINASFEESGCHIWRVFL